MRKKSILDITAAFLFLAILCTPFYFLGFWWAVLIDYTLMSAVMLIAIREENKNRY